MEVATVHKHFFFSSSPLVYGIVIIISRDFDFFIVFERWERYDDSFFTTVEKKCKSLVSAVVVFVAPRQWIRSVFVLI